TSTCAAYRSTRRWHRAERGGGPGALSRRSLDTSPAGASWLAALLLAHSHVPSRQSRRRGVLQGPAHRRRGNRGTARALSLSGRTRDGGHASRRAARTAAGDRLGCRQGFSRARRDTLLTVYRLTASSRRPEEPRRRAN